MTLRRKNLITVGITLACLFTVVHVSLLTGLSSIARLLRYPDKKSNQVGTIILPEGHMVITSGQVPAIRDYGLIDGILIIGRYQNMEFLRVHAFNRYKAFAACRGTA